MPVASDDVKPVLQCRSSAMNRSLSAIKRQFSVDLLTYKSACDNLLRLHDSHPVSFDFQHKNT